MIPSARSIAERYCDHYVIENVPRAPLNDPVVLDGRIFGLPIKYERGFETNFYVPQPPRYQRFWGKDGETDTAETSSFFFTERSRKWWASVKSVARDYPKQHLAKNTIPGQYIHHVCVHPGCWQPEYREDQHHVLPGGTACSGNRGLLGKILSRRAFDTAERHEHSRRGSFAASEFSDSNTVVFTMNPSLWRTVPENREMSAYESTAR